MTEVNTDLAAVGGGGDAQADNVIVNGTNSDDVVDASGLAAGAIRLTVNGAEGADVIIGGLGPDVIDRGGDADIVIQLVGNDAVTSATGADRKWPATHVRVIDGNTVIDVGGEKHKLPKADLSKLVRNAASS